MIVAPTNRLEPYEERIIEFKGLNRQPDTEPGEMVSMLNLSSNESPVLTQRRKRATYENVPEGITKVYMMQSVVDYSAGRAVKLAILGEDESGIGFWLDSDRQSIEYLNSHNISLSSLINDEVVLMTTKLCFFPHNVYYDLQAHAFGKLDADYATKQQMTLSLDAVNETTTATITPGMKEVDLSEIEIGDVVDFYTTVAATVYDKGNTAKDANGKAMTKVSTLSSDAAQSVTDELGSNWYVYDEDKTKLSVIYGDYGYNVQEKLDDVLERHINECDRVSLTHTEDGRVDQLVVQWWKGKSIIAQKTINIGSIGLSFEEVARLD